MAINLAEMLRHNTPQHELIRKSLLARYEISRLAMASRHTEWIRAEEDFRGYTPESTEDSRRKSERNSGNIHYTTITVPMTYAMALTAHTYWSSVFLNREPIFQLGSRKGNTEAAAQPMEALLDYQTHIGNILTPLFIWLLDPAKYGFGVISTFWDTEVKRVARLFEGPVIDPDSGIAIPGRSTIEKITEELPGYRGNRVYNVRPYNFFPDTRQALVDFQQGEFCADISYRSVQSIVSDPSFFNRERLLELKNRSRGGRVENVGSSQLQLPNIEDPSGTYEDRTEKGTTNILRMVANLVPKEWKLGEETQPEKWVFEVADFDIENSGVIISAEPFGHIHDQYPYDVIFYEVDGYVLDIRGMMEIGKDLNTATSWLLNSHMFNVRKALNDQLVVDPSRIVAKDLYSGGPGKILRLKPNAYGTNVRDVVSQLQVTDVTRQNVGDIQSVSEVLQRVLGVNDNVMGGLTPQGRKTATEVRTSSTFSISRLKTIAEYFSATGFSPLSQKLIANSQQFYFTQGQPESEVFKIVGDMVEGLGTVELTPDSIAGQFDFQHVDGTLPIDRTAQANLWKELILGLVQSGLGSTYNIDEMFNWVASLTGIRSLKRFKIQVQPDEVVQRQAQAGNIVPTGANRG